MDLGRFDSLILFGGSFDPPQAAHVKLPMLVRQRTGADAVIYMPAAVSPFKAGRTPAAPLHRLNMIRLALREAIDAGHARVLDDEINRAEAGRPSYTIDSIESLRARMRDGAALRLLIGGDQLRQFDRWKDWRRIVELAEPLVIVRPPDTRQSLLASLPDGFGRSEWERRLIETPPIDASSTEVRRRVAAGEPVGGLVDPAVEQYIREHGLYREEPG